MERTCFWYMMVTNIYNETFIPMCPNISRHLPIQAMAAKLDLWVENGETGMF